MIKKRVLKVTQAKACGYLLFFALLYSAPAFAATSGSATSLTIEGQGILPRSPYTAVIGLNLTTDAPGIDTLTGVTVAINSIYDYDDSKLLGVYLYKNTSKVTDGSGGQVFDSGDTPIGSDVGGVPWDTITIGGGDFVPGDDAGANAGYDYFIVIRTSDDITHFDAFTVMVTDTSFGFITGVYGITTGTITCESRIVELMPFDSDNADSTLEQNLLEYYPDPDLLVFGSPEERKDGATLWKGSLEQDQLLPMFKTTPVLGLDVGAYGGYSNSTYGFDDYLSYVILTFNPTITPNFNPASAFDHFGIDAEMGITFWRDSNQNRLPDSGELIARPEGYDNGSYGSHADEWLRLLTSGVASDGSATTLVDAEETTWTDNLFNSGCYVRIVSGDCRGQYRRITDVDHGTHTITVADAWDIDDAGNDHPGVNSFYEIIGNDWADRLVGSAGTVDTVGADSVINDANQNWEGNQYAGAIVRFLSGSGAAEGQWSMIASNTTNRLTLNSGITGIANLDDCVYVIDEWSLICPLPSPATDPNVLIPETADQKIDYLVCLRTSENVTFGSNFKVWVKPGDVEFWRASPVTGLRRKMEDVKTIYANLKLHYNSPSDYRRDCNQNTPSWDSPNGDDYSPFRIDATSGPIPVLGINLTDAPTTANGGNDTECNKTFDSITVRFSGTGFQTTDLAALSDTVTSGVSLYKDDKSADTENVGIWDEHDTLVTINTDPEYLEWTLDGGEYYVTLKPVAGQDVHDDDDYEDGAGAYRGDDYFVCIRTNSNQPYQEVPGARGIDFDDEIIVRVADHEVVLGDKQNADGSGVTVRTINANPPTFLTDVTTSDSISAQSGDIPVLGLNFIKPDTDPATDLYLSSLVVQFYSDDDSFTMDDLEDLSATATSSGLALYKDNKTTGTRGVFDSGDTAVDLAVVPIVWQKFTGEGFYRVHLILKSPAAPNAPFYINHEADLWPHDINDVAEGNNYSGPDYFLVIRTSDTISAGDKFRVRLMGSNVGFNDWLQVPSSSKYLDTRAVGFTTDASSVDGPYMVTQVNYDTLSVAATAGISAGNTLIFTSSAGGGNKIYLVKEVTANTVTCYEANFNGDGIDPGDQFEVFDINYRSYERITGRQLTCQTVTAADLEDEIPLDFRVDATSDPFAGIGLNVSDTQGNTLNRLRVYFNPLTDGLGADSALATLSSDATSGLAVYQDTNHNGSFDRTTDTVLPSITTGWKADYTDSFVDSDGIDSNGTGSQEPIPVPAGTVLEKFDAADPDIYWYDADGNSIWSGGDGLWVDNNANGTYQSATDGTIITGSLADGVSGSLVDENNGFAYYDSDGSTHYDDGEDIYFLGRDRDRLGYFVDLNLNPVVNLPADDSDGGPDFFVVFRTGSEIKYQDSFSLSLPSNGITFSSGRSFANTDLTTNPITSRIPVFLTDLVESGTLIAAGQQEPVLGINLYDSDSPLADTVSEVNIYFSGTNVQTNLEDLGPTTSSGVAFYYDNPVNGTYGVFDSEDDLVTPASISWVDANRVRITFNTSGANQVSVPDEDTGTDTGDDYFVVIKTRNIVTQGNTIQAQIRSSLSSPVGEGIKFAGGPPVPDNSGEYLTTGNVLTMQKFSLTVSSAYDTPTPSGTTYYDAGNTVTCSVTSPVAGPAGTQYVCTGWVGTGSVPLTGITNNTGLITITQNSILTWQWKTQYMLTTATSGTDGADGSVYPVTGWQDAGAVVVVTATPDPGSIFDEWTGDYTGDIPFISVTMSAPRSVTAHFILGAADAYQLFTAVSPAASGTVTFTPDTGRPDLGVGYYDNVLPDSDVVITAYPNSGYLFNYWSGQGDKTAGGPVEGATDNPITITMDTNRGLIAQMVTATYSLTANRLTTAGNQGVLPENGSTGMALFGFNLFTDTQIVVYLKQIHLNVQDADVTDGVDLDTGLLNFAVYKDNYASSQGYFSKEDTALDTSLAWTADGDTPGKFNGVLDLTSPDTLPVNDSGASTGYDYYLVLKTEAGLPHNLKFTATIDDLVITKDSADSLSVPSGTLTTHTLAVEAKVTDLLVVDTDYDYSIPEEMAEPDKDYLLRTDQDFLLTQDEYLDYDTGLNLPKFLKKPTVLPLDTPTAVLGIKVAGNAGTQTNATTYQTEALDSLTVTFQDTSGGRFNPQTKLNSLTSIDLAARGVAVYADQGDGIFGSTADFPLRIDTTRGTSSGYTWSGSGDTKKLQIFLDATDSRTVIPQTSNNFTDYFVVLRVNPTNPARGATFKSYLSVGDIKFKQVPLAGQNAFSLDDTGVDTGYILFRLSDLTPRYIDATSSPIPIVGLNLAFGESSNETFDQIKITLSGTGLDSSDLLSILGGSQTGGLTLYKDNKSSGQAGSFDASDTIVSIQPQSWLDEGGGKFSGLVSPSAPISRSGFTLSDDTGGDTAGTNRGDDYFICLATSETIDYLDKINVEVGRQDVQISGYSSVYNGNIVFDADLEDDVTADSVSANVPTFITDLTASGQSIDRGSDPTAVFKIKAYGPESGNPIYLQSVVAQIIPESSFTLSDLAGLDTAITSGLSLYKDANSNESFDDNDTLLTPVISPSSLSGGEEGYYRLLLQLKTPETVPDTGLTFFLVVRTNIGMALNDKFRARIHGSNIEPLRTYGIGYGTRSSNDDQLYQDRTIDVGGVDEDTLTVTTVVNNAVGNDYTKQWYVLVKSGIAKGKVYKVASLDGTQLIITCTGADFVSDGVEDGNTIRLFKVDAFTFEKEESYSLTGTGQPTPYLRLTFLNPTAAGEDGNRSYTVNWQVARDGGSGQPSGTILLYYDNNKDPANKSLITTLPFASLSGSYTWDTRSVPRGTYYLYGEVTEGSTTAGSYSTGTVGINLLPLITITAPTGPGEKALNQEYFIRWTAANLDLLSGSGKVSLFRVTETTYIDTTLIISDRAVTDSGYQWDTTGVPNGIYRIYAVLRDDDSTDTDLSTGSIDVRDYAAPAEMEVSQPADNLLLDGTLDQILYPSSPPTISRDQVLAVFKSSDHICWYDTWVSGEWDILYDSLWLDADDNSYFNTGDTLLAGITPGSDKSGVNLIKSNPFAYWDFNGSGTWDTDEAIVYEGEDGNCRFSYSNPVVDIIWDSSPAGQNAPTSTFTNLYLDTDTNPDNEFSGEIYSDTVLTGESLAKSLTYDFSQLSIAQHGTYYLALGITEENNWYPAVYDYAPGTVTVESAPDLVITRPETDTDIWPDYPFNITYLASDPDDSANFEFYLYDAASGDTYPIAGPLVEADGPGSYLWDYAASDTSITIPTDTYLFLRGVIYDGIWSDTDQADGRVRILEEAPSVTLGADATTTTITLTWVDKTPAGEGNKEYRIFRRDATGTDSAWVTIESASESAAPEPEQVDAGTNTWQYIDNDSELQADHSYNYYVGVYITEGGSDYLFTSNTISVTLLAFSQNPTGLVVTPGIMMADLRWTWENGNEILEDGFSIERKGRGETNFTVLGSVTGNSITFGVYTDSAYTDSMLVAEKFYQYRVRAFKYYDTGVTGYSGYSETVEVEIFEEINLSLEEGSVGSCFIATAAFGTPLAKEVEILRQFRERFLMQRDWGRKFVRFYNRHSPPVAEFIRPRPLWCAFTRGLLRPLIWLVNLLG
ncbi:MAG: CFI-box-CTERM domain-containing protein [Candidatus Omnitrophota bacterium]